MKETKMTHDEIIAMVMSDYTARLKREHEQREAIRRGDFIPCPTSSWNISDRH